MCTKFVLPPKLPGCAAPRGLRLTRGRITLANSSWGIRYVSITGAVPLGQLFHELFDESSIASSFGKRPEFHWNATGKGTGLQLSNPLFSNIISKNEIEKEKKELLSKGQCR
jgi:hypothetical protein